jgi:hypothetical protein
MISRARQLYVKLVAVFEGIDVRLLLFALLCLNFLSFRLSSNEEVYLPLARQFMDPSWISNSFMFTEWPGTRYLFQVIAGFALKYLTFEQVALGGRLLVFLVIVFPVGGFFKRLKIPNLAVILIFQLYLIRQNYFAGEFIFGDFEPKSLAYIAIFAGLNCLLDRKYLLATVYAVISSYFHILVGGWFFLLVFLFTVFYVKSWLLSVKQGMLFSVLIAPMVVYLGRVILKDGSVVEGVNIDWVTVFFRNAHHLAPLYLKEHLLRTSLQILGSAVLFGLALFVFAKKKGPLFDELYMLNVIILTILFIALPISLIDKNGTFLKFYLFRLAGLGMLLMYVYIYLFLSVQWKVPANLQLVLVLAGFYLVLAASFSTIHTFIHPDNNTDFEQLESYVIHQTRLTDVFLPLTDDDLPFSRKTRREVFVIYKFDPGGGKKIYEWYYRICERDKLNKDEGYLDELLAHYKLNYVISDHPLHEQTHLKIVFSNKSTYLYQIN